MKHFFTGLLLLSFLPSFAQNAAVGIGTTTPHASAALDVSSTDKGMLVPRMSSEQRKLILAPSTGLLVFDNTTSSFWFRNATAWVELVDSTKQPWQKAGNNVYVNNGDNVGIGTAAPVEKLEVAGTVRATSFVANPGTGGLAIGLDGVAGSTILRSGISSPVGGYGYLQAVKSEGTAWGDLALNPSGGNVGIGPIVPTQKLDVAGMVKAVSFLGNGATLSGVVNTTGAQTIGGTKTFTSALVANGNVGLGTDAPNAPLQFGNGIANRKLVLYETYNNDHQFLGFGINPGMLRYQTAASADDHVFFSGASSTSSNELMRIKGSGNVGIGTDAPAAKLDVAGTVNATNFTGNGGTLNNVVNTASAQTIGGAKTFSNNLIVNGNVGIGTNTPAAKLDVAGTVNAADMVVDAGGSNSGAINAAALRFGGQGAGEGIASKRTVGGNQKGLDFYTGGAPRMSVNEVGQVMIGTATPSGTLNINGNTTTSGNLYAGGGLTANSGGVTVNNGGINVNNGNVKVPNGNVLPFVDSEQWNSLTGAGTNTWVDITHAPSSNYKLMLSTEIFNFTSNGGLASATTNICTFYQNLNPTTTRIYVANNSSYTITIKVNWIVVSQ